MQGKGAGSVNRVELESQVLCAALRQSCHVKDRVGAYTSVRELSHLFPDLLPPPEKSDNGDASNKANFYATLGIKPQSSANNVIAAYLRTVRAFLRRGNVKEARTEYNRVLNAGFILRKPRLRLSHDLVVSRRWLHEEARLAALAEQEVTIDRTLPNVAAEPISAPAAAQATPASVPVPTPAAAEEAPMPQPQSAPQPVPQPVQPVVTPQTAAPAFAQYNAVSGPRSPDAPIGPIHSPEVTPTSPVPAISPMSSLSVEPMDQDVTVDLPSGWRDQYAPDTVAEQSNLETVPLEVTQPDIAPEPAPVAAAASETVEPVGEQPSGAPEPARSAAFVFDESLLRKSQPAQKAIPSLIQLMEAAQFINSVEVQALLAQMEFAPNVPLERLILNAGYVNKTELASLKLGESLIAQNKISMAQFQVAIYDERMSGLRMAESLQVRGWLSTEVRNAIDDFQRRRS